MGVHILLIEHYEFAPVLTCDHCGGIIADHEEGYTMWFWKDPMSPVGSMGKLYHLHRSSCQYLFQDEHKADGDVLTAAIDTHFYHLLHNLDYDPWSAKEAAELLAQL